MPNLRIYWKIASEPRLGSSGNLEPNTIHEFLIDASDHSEMVPSPSCNMSSNTIRHHCKSIARHGNMDAIQCLFLPLSGARPSRVYCHISSHHMVKVNGGKHCLQAEVLKFGEAKLGCWQLEVVQLLFVLLVQLEFFHDWIRLV